MTSTITARPSPGRSEMAPKACETERQTNRSVRSGFRVLRALASGGMGSELQISVIADATGLKLPHVSKLLRAGIDEGLVEYGSRRGAYRLTHQGLVLTGPAWERPANDRARQTVDRLHAETRLAVALHEPGWRVGVGLHLELLDVQCPIPALHHVAALQVSDIRRSAAGRAALAFLPAHLATDAEDQQIHLPQSLRETITASRVAVSRGEHAHTFAACVFRKDSVVATLSVMGPTSAFDDPLRVQEYVVLLRRAAEHASTPHSLPAPIPAGGPEPPSSRLP